MLGAVIFLIAVFLSLGIYKILAMMLRIPSSRQIRTFRDFVRMKQPVPVYIVWLSHIVPLSKSACENLGRKLKIAGINQTPREYAAYGLVKSLLVFPAIIAGFIFFPAISVIAAFFGINIFTEHLKDADKKVSERSRMLEYQLPQFTSYLARTFRRDRNVMGAISAYAMSENNSILGDELKTTIADMKTGHYEQALMNLDGRLSSPMLSDVVSGLISALSGNDMSVYFDGLEIKFSDHHRQLLRRLAAKKPSKIGKMSMLVLLAMLMLVLTMMAATIIGSMSELF